MIPLTLLAYLEAEVVAAREHLNRATAALERAKSEVAIEDPLPPSDLVGLTVRCGTCRVSVREEEFSDHFRRCRREAALATTRALRSAVLEEVAMDRLHGRQLEI